MDYKNGKIYVIRNHINDKVYVGSTTTTLTKRFSYHRCPSKIKHKPNVALYIALNEIGRDYFYIELIETYPCKNRQELEAREGYWIRHFDSFMNGYNMNIAGRKQMDRYNDNPEKYKAFCRQYYNRNKDIFQASNKQYYESHKTERQEYIRQYYEKNKEKQLSKMLEKVICDCGSEVARCHLSRHYKTLIHQHYLSSITNSFGNAQSL